MAGRALALALAAAALAAALLSLALLAHKHGQAEASGRVYVYHVSVSAAGGRGASGIAYYTESEYGTVYGQRVGNGSFFALLKSARGVMNALVETPHVIRKLTYYAEYANGSYALCVNSSASATVAGERVTVTRRECAAAAAQLPSAGAFDELVRALLGLPGPASPSHWRLAGAALTPYGRALVYANVTEVPVLQLLGSTIKLVLEHEKWALPDGAVYAYRVRAVSERGLVAALTYTLRNVTPLTPELSSVIGELAREVRAAAGGGLEILRAAERVGMPFNGSWPALVAFFDLHCPYCARLFVYNLTLLEGRRLALVDLVVHPDAEQYHESLRCLYKETNASRGAVMGAIVSAYKRLLGGSGNYSGLLPREHCAIDVESGRRLAELLAGEAATPIVAVVYPNGSYRVIVGYRPSEIARALGAAGGAQR
jgi:hypothetical protein